MQKSGTNVVEGVTDFYNLIDRSGLLDEEKINETKNNLFNQAESNKENKEDTNNLINKEDKKDSDFFSYNIEGLDPRKNIFNYNPKGEVNIDKDFGNFELNAGVDASLKTGINPNYNIGFNNKNLNLDYGDGGFKGNFNKEFGENANLNISARNGDFNPSFDTSILGTDFEVDKNRANIAKNFLNDKVNVNIAQNFDGGTDISGTYTGDNNLRATINPNEFLLSKTYQAGGGDLTLSGKVPFDGGATGQVNYERELGPGELNVFYNPNDYGFNYNFLNRKF